MTGGQLVSAADGRFGAFFSVTRSQVYRELPALADAGLLPTVVHTSLLTRAIRTSNTALDACGRSWIPVVRHWRLNERHYGALQGKDKKQTLEEYGEEQFMTWRRSFDVPPPPLDDDAEWSQAGDPRYADLGEELPRTECLADALDNQVEFGVWGGMTERERRAILKRRPNVRSWSRLLETAREEHERSDEDGQGATA